MLRGLYFKKIYIGNDLQINEIEDQIMRLIKRCS